MTCTSSPLSTRASTMCEPMNPAPPVTTIFLFAISRSACGQYDADCLKNNKQIEQKRAMFEIVEVIREFLFGLGDVRSVVRVSVMLYLRPTRESGSRKVARIVVRDPRTVFACQRR